MKKSERRVAVYEVLFDGSDDGPSGPAGDGTFVARFGARDSEQAIAFAKSHTVYGRPCRVPEADLVPVSLARRWGVA